MKQFISIAFMTLATCMLILSTVIPHHHHGTMICISMEICECNDPADESHDHHAPDDINNHQDCCISESKFFVKENRQETKCKVSSCDLTDHTHLFPVIFLLSEFLIYKELPNQKPKYGEFILSYKSMDASQTYGLRAPPFFA